MVTIRAGNEEDIERINAFYASQRRSQDAAADDFVLLLAENDTQEVIATVRLCRDQNYLILRGMLIAHAFRRQGLGTQMLHALEPSMSGQECLLPAVSASGVILWDGRFRDGE